MVYSRLTIYQTLWIKWTSNFQKLMTLLRGVVDCILTILWQCQNETYEQKMFRSNVQAFFMQPIVISLLSFYWMQLVVQTIVCDAGVFLSRWKLPCYIRIPVATMYDVQHRDTLVSRNRGTRKEEDGRGGKEFSHPSCPLWLSPTLRRFSQYGGYTSREIRALKENSWECKFWFVLVQCSAPASFPWWK